MLVAAQNEYIIGRKLRTAYTDAGNIATSVHFALEDTKDHPLLLLYQSDSATLFEHKGIQYAKIRRKALIASSFYRGLEEDGTLEIPRKLHHLMLAPGIVAYRMLKPHTMFELSRCLDNDQERALVVASNSNIIDVDDVFIHPWKEYFGVEYPILITGNFIYFCNDLHIAAIIEK
jgi:hypothetical protein